MDNCRICQTEFAEFPQRDRGTNESRNWYVLDIEARQMRSNDSTNCSGLFSICPIQKVAHLSQDMRCCNELLNRGQYLQEPPIIAHDEVTLGGAKPFDSVRV